MTDHGWGLPGRKLGEDLPPDVSQIPGEINSSQRSDLVICQRVSFGGAKQGAKRGNHIRTVPNSDGQHRHRTGRSVPPTQGRQGPDRVRDEEVLTATSDGNVSRPHRPWAPPGTLALRRRGLRTQEGGSVDRTPNAVVTPTCDAGRTSPRPAQPEATARTPKRSSVRRRTGTRWPACRDEYPACGVAALHYKRSSRVRELPSATRNPTIFRSEPRPATREPRPAAPSEARCPRRARPLIPDADQYFSGSDSSAADGRSPKHAVH